jgi:hypothetical protein
MLQHPPPPPTFPYACLSTNPSACVPTHHPTHSSLTNHKSQITITDHSQLTTINNNTPTTTTTHRSTLPTPQVYSGSMDFTVRVVSGTYGEHLYTLVGHTGPVGALAVGIDGKIFTGSVDRTIWVWSDLGAVLHRQTLTAPVTALAVGIDGKVYSASSDNSVRVWKGDDMTYVM